jgi:predicted HD phosphohydrolase
MATATMEVASFTRMDEGTVEDYALTGRLAEEYKDANLADNVLALLKATAGPKLGYQIDRYQHALQSATRALRDGVEEEMVVAALLHDIGDTIAPDNHSEVAAAILKPYISEKTHWIIAHHGLFQGYFYYQHLGWDPDARERYRGHPHFQACADFCERWDQVSFDPDYDTLRLETFEPMVRKLFARKSRYYD